MFSRVCEFTAAAFLTLDGVTRFAHDGITFSLVVGPIVGILVLINAALEVRVRKNR